MIIIITLFISALALESFGGQRLLQKADINVASHINMMFRIKVAQDEPGLNKLPDQRHVTFMREYTIISNL